MGGKSSTISTEEPRLGNLRVQTSMQGLAVPWVRGKTRIAGNLLWFGNFKAIATTTTTEQGGKGGGGVTQVDTKYSYFASAIMALHGGTSVGIESAWKGKNRIYGQVIGGYTQTNSQTFPMPANRIIDVPLNGNAFAAHISVVDYDAANYRDSA